MNNYYLVTKQRTDQSKAFHSVVATFFSREKAEKHSDEVKGQVFEVCSLSDLLVGVDHSRFKYVNNGGEGLVVDCKSWSGDCNQRLLSNAK